MINSNQRGNKVGGITVEEGPHAVDNIVFWFTLEYREGLVQKLYEHLVKMERHFCVVKGYGFEALG